MIGELCLLDTDILSYILKQQEPVCQVSRAYLKRHHRFTISCLTYYECTRGYKAVGATKRLQVFQELLNFTEIVYLNQTILDKSGEIYSKFKPKGIVIGEFDLLIGATAIVHGLTLVTNNEKHYEPIKAHFPLKMSNWMNIPIAESVC
jgi:predicted nucleic acid-binding protein